MRKLKRFLLLTFFAFMCNTLMMHAQSTGYIVKSGTDNGEFYGGVFIGLNSKYIATGTAKLIDKTDSIITNSWKDESGVYDSNDSLTKFAATGWGNSGAVSYNQLKKLCNGWIEYIVPDSTSTLEFGLTNSDTAGLDSIQYAVQLYSGFLYIYNKGVKLDSIGKLNLNDTIRIERLGNDLMYTKNGKIVFNQEVNGKDSLRAEVAIYSTSSSFVLHSTFGLENFVFNTVGMDTLTSPDTLRYAIHGINGVSGIYNSNTSVTFNPTGIASGVKTVTTSFYGFSGSDSTQILFDIDKYRQISNVRLKYNDTINPLDSSLFKIDRKGTLALLNGSNTYESQFSPFLNLLLDGGIALSPNGDGLYDSLQVESNVPVTSYSIQITSIAGDTLYESSNISLAWNGKNSSGNLVEMGNYYYHIVLNGRLTEGLFLVEY